MKSITKIGFKNFRVFEQAEFDLKRITLLTGANSSGKSTLFKSILLLKQNIQNNGNFESLVLSNKPYYLGTFTTTKNDKNNDDFFSIIFGFDVLPFKLDTIDFDFRIEYMFRQNGEYANLSNIIISNENHNFINVDCESHATTIVDERKIINLLKDYDQIVDLLNEKQFEEFQNNLSNREQDRLTLFGIISEYAKFNFAENSITELFAFGRQPNAKFEELNHKFNNSIDFSIKREADKTDFDFLIPNDEGKNCLNDIAKEIINKEVILGERKFNQIYRDKDIYERLSRDAMSRLFEPPNLVLPNENIKAFIDFVLNFAERIIPNTTRVLIERLKNIEYLSSNRSRLSRYFQNSNELSEFDEIIYEYSNSITDNSFPKDETPPIINKWLQKFEIGEEIIVERSEGTLSYVFIKRNGIRRNIADLGFGIIQLLPILMKISVIARREERDGTILLIEEPEANLHPKFQSILTELFIETSKKYNIHFIIETHSEYLIRELQIQIANQIITPNDVSVFYINREFDEDKRQIENIVIDENGKIEEIEKFGDEFYKYSDKQEISLLNINRNTFIEQFDLLKQKEIDTDEKIILLEQQIDIFTKKLDTTVYEKIIMERFNVSNIETLSTKYLISGQYLLEVTNTSGDYSPVIIQYGRAIENELKYNIFNSVNSSIKWSLGLMQGYLNIYKYGRPKIRGDFYDRETDRVRSKLTQLFQNPSKLRINLINSIRNERNDAGHSGMTKTKDDARAYINKVNGFLDIWIREKK